LNMAKTFHDGKVTLHAGDCLEVLKAVPENSIDAVVTDPPYHLTSIVKRFGNANAAPAKGNEAFIRASRGFMGKQWDGGDIAFQPELWAEVLRVLKPGGHMVCFGGTRTYHRMVCAIEDAGFEIRDQLAWDADDRLASKHPTVKPVDLMQWLVRLVCPKGATVLDPFAGTGTTGAASFIEGRRCVLIEREAEYLADIEKRMGMLLSGFEERSWKLAKPEPLEALPLFALTEPAT
jgi:DNA modification methylase